jgi:WS/DGAT/MGAT family acyltransferase
MRHRESLSGVDTAWLRMDHPTNLMTITAVLVLDDPIDYATMRSILQERLLRFRRFKQRVMRLEESPYWEMDPYFEIEQHLHRSALPAPAGQAELQEQVSDLMGIPLDFSKPPWQMHLIEDYQGGSALIVRLHHCIADGIALVQVLLSLTDEFFSEVRQKAHPANASAWDLVPSFFRPTLDAVTSTVKGVAHVGNTLAREGLTMALRPKHLLKRVKQGMSVSAALTKFALLQPDSPTLFKGELGVRQHAAWSAPVPLEDVKAIGRALDAKVNDVLLGAVAGALRHYLASRNKPTDEVSLRALIPVNLRPQDRALKLGNRFGLVFLTLPVGEPDRRRRVLAVKRRMDDIKASSEAVTALGILQALGAVPLEVEDRVVELLSSKASAVMTNVPGPRTTLHIADRPLQHVMPWVPRAGKIGMGVSIFSYAGEVRLGIATDAGLVPDPETILEGYLNEFKHLHQAVGD